MNRSKVHWYNKYIKRFSYQEEQLKNHPINSNTELIVVIPCFNETGLLATFQALLDATIPQNINIEILTVINHGENESEEVKQLNEVTLIQANNFSKKNTNRQISFINLKAFNLQKKHAGVGLARKIGMDEALHRFQRINKNGIIVCFDADSLCEKNYFETIYNHFNRNQKLNGVSIHFEHPIEGTSHQHSIYAAIIDYELHLRYYKNAIKLLGVPYAYHTIGSSMAVKCEAYAKQGGMNKRKAGVDFYFLSKIIQLGNFSEITNTKVIPSPRVSDRVPFGTGKAIGDIIDSGQEEYLTYDFDAFLDLKLFFDAITTTRTESNYDHLPNSLKLFLDPTDYHNKLAEIRKNTASLPRYKQRFYFVFDAFFILKFVHFFRDNIQNNKSLNLEAKRLLKALNISFQATDNNKTLLSIYRKLDCNQSNDNIY